MDKVGADFNNVIKEIRNKLGANAWPVLIPLGKEDYLKGQLDVINKKAIIYSDSDSLGSVYEVMPIPDDHKELVDRAYNDLVEQVANLDDEVGTLFLEEKPVTPKELKAGIRRLTIANQFIPVAGGSAFKNKGVQYLVDAVIDYLPSPLDIPPAKGIDPDTHAEKLAPTGTCGVQVTPSVDAQTSATAAAPPAAGPLRHRPHRPSPPGRCRRCVRWPGI